MTDAELRATAFRLFNLRRTPYLLVVETNQYAGNFERELTAYATGAYGECGVGAAEAAVFTAEESATHITDLLLGVPDEDGCHRPCAVSGTPSAATCVVMFLTERPDLEDLAVITRRVHAFPAYAQRPDHPRAAWAPALGLDKLQVLGLSLLEVNLTVTPLSGL